jgi:ethanolamine utilization protein EutA (predicted chaperonin)
MEPKTKIIAELVALGANVDQIAALINHVTLEASSHSKPSPETISMIQEVKDQIALEKQAREFVYKEDEDIRNFVRKIMKNEQFWSDFNERASWMWNYGVIIGTGVLTVIGAVATIKGWWSDVFKL